jgi:hypothetical protein
MIAYIISTTVELSFWVIKKTIWGTVYMLYPDREKNELRQELKEIKNQLRILNEHIKQD